MQKRTIGSKGPEVSALGLGLMGMSDFYGGADESESVRVIHAALDAGIRLLDTGDFYGSGHNEMLLARALASASVPRDEVFIQVKFGALRSPDGGFIGFDGRPVAVKNALAQTLRRLRTDYVDLYMPARLDPTVPIEDTIGAIAECVTAGWVRHVGLSEVGAETIRRAQAVHPITGLQREYSLITREIEAEVLPTLREIGAGLTAYGVLSRGLLSGKIRQPSDLQPQDYRAHLPRFQGENLARNLRLVDALVAMAEDKTTTASQLAIAWALHRGADVVPLIGARRSEQLSEAVQAVDMTLDDDEIQRLEAALSPEDVAGDRYDRFGMAMIGD
ncbi:MAG: aldo/keto reductase [Myxococcota bacterium]